MDITQFTEDIQARQYYDYKMLVYGNYTYRDNLEADSLVEVLRNVIPYLSKRYSIHFTLLTPQLIKSLQFPNTEQIIYDLPTYCNQMRTHFDSIKFMDILDWRRNDFDIIYCHVPEHGSQIANTIFNTSHLRPNIIGYAHWAEVPENSPYEKTMFDAWIAGALEMSELGVNSNWLKDLIIKRAGKKYNDKVLQDLQRIIQPHYLGVDRVEVRDSKLVQPKTVMFNHRSSGYTGWNWFVEAMDEIWQERQDFKVLTTLASIDKPWCKKVNAPTRNDYMNTLKSAQFGVGCFETYSAWSISTTDGLSIGVPYLLPDNLCYPEMVPSDYPYLYSGREEFKNKFKEMLDSDLDYDTSVIANSMKWEARIANWFDGWDKVFDLRPISEKSKAIHEIEAIIKKHRYLKKKDLMDILGWGVHIKWSQYRNHLRSNPNIKFTKEGYEYVL